MFAMKANGVKAEELIDASVVAQIENPSFTAPTQEEGLDKTVDATSEQVLDENVLDQLTMKPPSNDEPNTNQNEESTLNKIEISV